MNIPDFGRYMSLCLFSHAERGPVSNGIAQSGTV